MALCAELLVFLETPLMRIRGCSWNALGESDLIDFISQFSELRVWKILIF
jgi:hypothetical protein